MKRISAFIISVLLTLSLFSSCSQTEWKVKVGKESFSESEYNYFYQNHLADLQYNYPDLTDDEADERAKEMTVDSLKYICAVNKLAEKYDISLTDEEKDEAREQYDAWKGQAENEEDFIAELEANHLNRELCIKLVERDRLEIKLRDHMSDEASGIIVSDDETVQADINKNFYRATQILIQNDEGDDTGANAATAQLICDRVNNGESFYDLGYEYSEDSIDMTEGYYFTHGEMLEEFEEAVLALDENETSGVVKSRYGYHIIRRLPLYDGYIDEHFEQLRDKYKSRCINERIEECKKEFSVKYK